MAIPPASTVAAAIKARHDALDTGGAPDQQAALEALVDEILKAVKLATVPVPGAGLIAPAGTAGGPVSGTATGSIT